MPLEINSGAEAEAQAKLFKHFLKYKTGEIFYHYCSTETLRTICETKTLRFSDINMMNDYAESAYGYSIFEQAAGRLIDIGIEKSFFDEVDKIISPMQAYIHPVMCSFSKKPDVLSQWRAYADDGRGVAIGFSSECFAQMPVSLMNVEYDRERQITEMMAILGALHDVEQEGGHQRSKDFKNKCQEIAMYKTAYKNPSFFEEQEVRCLHILKVVMDDKSMKLVDPGGYSGGKKVRGETVKYRTKDGDLIGFVDIPFRLHKVAHPIKEIWCGPKNRNHDGNLIYMLSTYGITGYTLHRSQASYR